MSVHILIIQDYVSSLRKSDSQLSCISVSDFDISVCFYDRKYF